MKKVKNILRNEKGLTLIELLAVVVILGIIAAIAIPAIAGLIDNTKRDAHVANAEQVINAARLAATSDKDLSTGTITLSLQYLYEEKYLDEIADPDKTEGGYIAGNANTSTDGVLHTIEPAKDSSYVTLENGKVSAINLTNGTRGILEETVNGSGQLKRSDVDVLPSTDSE